MLIGDIARQADVTPSTIRYYEEIGLLTAPPRSDAGSAILRRNAGGTRVHQEGAGARIFAGGDRRGSEAEPVG
jgi:hypothetical protein